MRIPRSAILSAAAIAAPRRPPASAAFAFASVGRPAQPAQFHARRALTALGGGGPDKGDSMPHDEIEAAQKAAASRPSGGGGAGPDGAGPPTIFDKIIAGDIPAKKVHEDDLVLAFRDVNPQAPTHIIVIPKDRDGLVGLSNAREDQKALLGHLVYVAGEVGKKECPEGYRLVINDGRHGGQSVYHLHVHVMGGRQMRWPPG